MGRPVRAPRSMSYRLGCDGDGPGEDDMGKSSERKDGKECVSDWI